MFYLVERGKEKYVSHYWGAVVQKQLKEERKFCSRKRRERRGGGQSVLRPILFEFSLHEAEIQNGPPERNPFYAIERLK